jgi:hypothetical protein
MAKKKKIIVQGIDINVSEINKVEYISLTDIAKRATDTKPALVIQRWLRNQSTLLYLKTWETVHNPNFKVSQIGYLFESMADNRYDISPTKFINLTKAIGLTTKSGRNGGTYAHHEIALEFCTWLSPEFKVYFYKEWVQLKAEEYNRRSLEFHVKRITDSIDEARNWLDTIPGQEESRNRIKDLIDEDNIS